MRTPLRGFAAVAVLSARCVFAAGADSASVGESARNIPIAYDVDVVVVGGSTGAVAAAVEAARAGATVFLAAPRPYLGEDVCASLRLWLEPQEQPEESLEESLFVSSPPPGGLPPGVPFTYKADTPTNPKHPDTAKDPRLTDGRWSSAPRQSVQYDDDVTIVAALDRSRRLRSVHVLAYQRPGDFEVETVTVWTSADGKSWTQVAATTNPLLSTGGHEEDAFPISVEFDQKARHVKVKVAKTAQSSRILLGEIRISETAAGETATRPARSFISPMQVKRTLDKALLDAKVKFLYGCVATDVLHGADGRLAGIVMANRAGRQAVLAKVVIDATERAAVARLAGATFRPYPAGPQTFRRVVIGGDLPGGDGLQARRTGLTVRSVREPHEVIECVLTIPMKDGEFRSFAEAEQVARDRTFDAKQTDAAERLFQVPPDPLVGRKSATGDWSGPDGVRLDFLRPAGVERIYVLGGCADLSRASAEQLLRPLNLMRVGRRVGATAAYEARSVARLSGVAGPCGDTARRSSTDVREALGGLRPGMGEAPSVLCGPHDLPVLGEYDVVVIGGGTGGAPAGIAAARRGARTLVVEYQDALGGVGTVGMISSYYCGYREGFTAEVDFGVQQLSGQPSQRNWNIACKQEWWRRELRKAGAEIWFSSLGCGALVRDGRVVGAVVATPQGRGAVLAKVVIDATGNADIAAAAGAACMAIGDEDAALQGTGLPPRNLGASYTNTDYTFTDDADPLDAWRMLVTAKWKFPGAYDLGSLIDSRERQRIVGDFVVSPLDILNQRTYPDTVAIHHSNFDTHGFTVHPVFTLRFPDKKLLTANLPYRCLLPRGLDGILVTGLAVSAHRDAMPILRMQPCIQNQGYAAGLAAAQAAREGKPTRSIDIRKLQQELVQVGNLTPEVPSQKDSYPPGKDKIAEAARQVVHHYDGLSVVLTDPDTSLPLLRKAYDEASSPQDRLTYANILGMMGDATGVETLIAAVASSAWDKGWNFRGMGQFGNSVSPLDAIIISLGRTRDKRAIGPILDKVRQLDASREFSHHRSVALALEALDDPAAAGALAELLAKPNMTGHAMVELPAGQSAVDENRSLALREILLARALYACGDRDGLGEKILRQYQHDLRALYARHAQAVLNRK